MRKIVDIVGLDASIYVLHIYTILTVCMVQIEVVIVVVYAI